MREHFPTLRRPLIVFGAVALCLITPACRNNDSAKGTPPNIVGAWLVRIPEAPFQYHMFIFNSDRTLLQSNPDAGDPGTSDSNGMGEWVPEGDRIKGKFVEVTADRTTHQFVSRGEISFSVTVTNDVFRGVASAMFYDAGGQRLRGPLAATMEGHRVAP